MQAEVLTVRDGGAKTFREFHELWEKYLLYQESLKKQMTELGDSVF